MKNIARAKILLQNLHNGLPKRNIIIMHTIIQYTPYTLLLFVHKIHMNRKIKIMCTNINILTSRLHYRHQQTSHRRITSRSLSALGHCWHIMIIIWSVRINFCGPPNENSYWLLSILRTVTLLKQIMRTGCRPSLFTNSSYCDY